MIVDVKYGVELLVVIVIIKLKKSVNMKKFKIQDYNKETDWNKYLENLDIYVKSLGYRKYYQKHNNEVFIYWKTFNNKSYQVGLSIYDWRKYPQFDSVEQISIQFRCMPIDINGHCDLTVSQNMEISEFEEMSEIYYNNIKSFCK